MASLLALPPQTAAQAAATPNPAAAGQTPNLTAQANPAGPVSESLGVYVLEGQNEIHDIRTPVTAMPVVEVRDENSLPLEGAEVTFELPATGPSGTFAGQQSKFTARTNAQGQATAVFTPNGLTGRFNIRVTATSGNRIGHAVIPQTNALRSGIAEPKRGLFKLTWWKVAIVAGVGATVAILVTRGGSSSSVTLIPGAPTFGAP